MEFVCRLYTCIHFDFQNSVVVLILLLFLTHWFHYSPSASSPGLPSEFLFLLATVLFLIVFCRSNYVLSLHLWHFLTICMASCHPLYILPYYSSYHLSYFLHLLMQFSLCFLDYHYFCQFFIVIFKETLWYISKLIFSYYGMNLSILHF